MRGVPVNVTVLSPLGKAVNARLTYGDESVSIDERSILDTDGDGKIRLGIPSNTTQYFTVKSKGFAPELVTAAVGRDPIELTTTLQPAQTLSGRVFDAAGHPISGAAINIGAWRGLTTLRMIAPTVSDADGRFTWESRPVDEVEPVLCRRDTSTPTHVNAIAGRQYVILLK